ADAAAAVVLAHLDGVAAADEALLRPVQPVRGRLVRDPVAVGVPKRTRLEHEHAPAGAGEPLRKDAAAGAAADDHDVDLVAVGEAPHALDAGNSSAVNVEQPVRVVGARP